MSDERASGVILSFLLGGLTGAALAVLFAPRSGRETRDILQERIREGAERGRELRDRYAERGREFKERAVDRGREIVDEANTAIDRGRGVVTSQRERITAAVEAGRQAYRDEKEKS
jgi:gas vesicle protein